MTDLSFNVLTDPWIPLDGSAGRAAYASYVDLMSGVRDAADLVHPRDDCRFFARMLLSALTQALFSAANRKELLERIEAPLAKDVVLRRVEEVRADFELMGGEEPWMQPVGSELKTVDNETRNVFLDVAKHLLFRPAVMPDALCMPCAVAILYGIQAFTPKGGRGYSPNVRGAPPTTTLVSVPGSVRKSVWASTLHGQCASAVVYGPEPERPWRCQAAEKDGGAIGLCEGLFWKPRALRLTNGPGGACAACGLAGIPLVAVVAFGPCQKRTGEMYRHPMSPCVRRKKTKTTMELRFAKLEGDRPAWTALADWVSGTAGDGEGILPAPVVGQYTEQLAPPGESTSLLVLDFGTRDMSILHRFFETFPLSLRLTDRDVADTVRARVAEAEAALDALKTACVRLHMKNRPSAKLQKTRRARERKERALMHDASAAFWQRTEPSFWRIYDAAVGAGGDEQVAAEDGFRKALRRVALELFDAHAAPSLTDPSRIAVLAEVRAALGGALDRARSASIPNGGQSGLDTYVPPLGRSLVTPYERRVG